MGIMVAGFCRILFLLVFFIEESQKLANAKDGEIDPESGTGGTNTNDKEKPVENSTTANTEKVHKSTQLVYKYDPEIIHRTTTASKILAYHAEKTRANFGNKRAYSIVHID
jgi:hypothetical protein